MLLLKKPQNQTVDFFVLPNNAIKIMGDYYLVDADISTFTPQQIVDYKIRTITDSQDIADIQKLINDIWDGVVCLMTTGPNPKGDPLTGDDLAGHLRAMKFVAKLEAASRFDTSYQALTNVESQLEQSTWAQQLAEATAFTANNSATTTLLSVLAPARNQTVAEYAADVISAATEYSTAQTALIANLKTAYQTIDNCTTAQDLRALGWI
jgi:hypothetical protein